MDAIPSITTIWTDYWKRIIRAYTPPYDRNKKGLLDIEIAEPIGLIKPMGYY
jgi:hypothetical protein